MENSETTYIKYCKSLIEKMLGWRPSNEWKQRDYLNLIELIENKTGILLSLSTIKRIWKPNYEGTPHPSTLEAFALFLNYRNWLDFKEKNQPNVSTKNNGKFSAGRFKSLFNHKSFIALVFILFFSGITFTLFQMLRFKKEEPAKRMIFNPGEVKFSCNNSVSKGVPNTIIFNYDVSHIQADSFFIQQSWNNYRRDRVQNKNNHLTSVYYYPGHHKAKLIANDSVIKEIDVHINTGNWLALARYNYMDDIPLYIRNKDLVSGGVLQVTPKHLKADSIAINKNLIVSYYYVDDFKKLSSRNFNFETQLKCDSIINNACPRITICILGEKGINIIPLTTKGCIGNLTIKIGNTIIHGKNNDLSSFGVDVYKWQQVKISIRNNKATIAVNKDAYEIQSSEDIGNVVGFNVNFTGTGSIAYVRLSDNNKMVYHTSFDE